jgi:hypothetical protein
MPRLTATEARGLSGKTLDEKIDSLLAVIEKVAREGKRELRTGYQHREDPDLWIQGGYSHTHEWDAAKIELEKLGYTVTFFYEERQFVDMYTKITW